MNNKLNSNNILDYSELFILIETELPEPITFGSKIGFVIFTLYSPKNKHTTLNNIINDLSIDLMYTKDYTCPNNQNYFVVIFNNLFYLYRALSNKNHKSKAHLLKQFHNIFEKCQRTNPTAINREIISKFYNSQISVIDLFDQNLKYTMLYNLLSELVIYFDYNNYFEGIDITYVLSQFNNYTNMSHLNIKEKSKIFNCCSLIMIYITLSTIHIISEKKLIDKKQLLTALEFISKHKKLGLSLAN